MIRYGSAVDHPMVGQPHWEMLWEPASQDNGDADEITAADVKEALEFSRVQGLDIRQAQSRRGSDSQNATAHPHGWDDEDDGRDVELCRRLASSVGLVTIREMAQAHCHYMYRRQEISRAEYADKLRLINSWRP